MSVLSFDSFGSGGIEKRIEFSGETEGQLDNLLLDLNYLDKLAANEIDGEVGSFINSLRPRKGRIYVLNVALGDSDIWGTNNNGEFFFGKRELTDYPNILAKFPFLSKYRYGGLQTDHPDFGSSTFTSGPAHFFDHHRNKDIARAHGRCIFDHYNPVMQRVELIFELWPDKMRANGAGDILDMLENDIPIRSSMGCRVPWDMCSICNNIARTKRYYCECLLHKMNQVLNDGRRVGPLNFFARFHDMSRVRTNADKSSYVLKKVAKDLSESEEKPKEKPKPKAKKKADINKKIEGVAEMVDLSRSEPRIPAEKLRHLSKCASFPDLIDAATKTCFVLKPEEFQYLFLEAAKPGLGEKFAGLDSCFATSLEFGNLPTGDGTRCVGEFDEFVASRWIDNASLQRRFLGMRSNMRSKAASLESSALSGVSSLYNTYICGIMRQVLTCGVSQEFLKTAAINPKDPFRLVTPTTFGAGALAYLIAHMVQSAKTPEEQQEAAESILSSPRAAGILTMLGTALLRRKMRLGRG